LHERRGKEKAMIDVRKRGKKVQQQAERLLAD
jgi:hypothetical protein